jgi:hypothetical protein
MYLKFFLRIHRIVLQKIIKVFFIENNPASSLLSLSLKFLAQQHWHAQCHHVIYLSLLLCHSHMVYSVLQPEYSQYFGFTEGEVKDLTTKSQLENLLPEIKDW